jgi:predicted branched-subunit amino acid permease
VLAQALAVVAGSRLPTVPGLQLAAPLALTGLLAKSTSSRPAALAAAAAATVATAGAGLPFHSAVLVGALAGIATGSLVMRRGARA